MGSTSAFPSRPVTHKDVARHAGVSVATVSYVVNNGPRPVAPATRARVEAAITELGYYPNDLASGLRRRRSGSIGLIMPSITNTFYAEVAHELERVCSEAGFLVLLCNTGGERDLERKFITMLRAKQVDGLVILPQHDPMTLLHPMRQASVPTVVLEHDLAGVPSIAFDDRHGGALATRHLLDLGHTRVALLRQHPTSALSHTRLDGYREALAQRDIPFDPALVVECGVSLEDGARVTQELLSRPGAPTGIVAHNDMLAMGVLHGARLAGRSVPRDLSVVGYDDIASAAFASPPLTTVRSPKVHMGRLAAQIVLALVRGDPPPDSTITLPVELVRRETTAWAPQ